MKRPRQTLLVGLPRSLRGREPRGGDEQRGGRGDDAADAVEEGAEVAEESEPLHPQDGEPEHQASGMSIFTTFRYSEMCETPERGAHEGGGGLDEDTGPEAAGENPGRGEEEDWVAEAGPDVELRQGRVTPAEYLHRGH